VIELEYILLIGSALILLSVAIVRFLDNFGVPALLLFLVIGMLAGSEGIGGIHFDDANLARSVGIVALVLILFAGGLDTKWSEVRPMLWHAVGLATFGVLLTAIAVGVFVAYLLNLPLIVGMLLGSVISSTDAAAVFSVLRSRNVNLRGQLKPLLELESGSNDPMAVFLTIGFIQMITYPEMSYGELAILFFTQMGIGGLAGLAFGRLILILMNRLKSSYEGIYMVFTLAFAALIYSSTAVVGGSGFLAVYIAGVIAGNGEFVQKRSLLRFFDGLAWLSQIGMFLTLGLLVYPSNLLPIVSDGLLIAVFLMFVARPVSVFLTLAFSGFNWREKAFVAWTGLRGAVPIVLATFFLSVRVPQAGVMFSIVFFIVLSSALLQGWSIPLIAKLLRVDAQMERRRQYPLEFAPVKGLDTELIDLIVPYHSAVAGNSIVELGMPEGSLIVLISRGDEYLVPTGGTIIEAGDTLLVLTNQSTLPEIREILSRQVREEEGG
jgi:cell volume regulation protein A